MRLEPASIIFFYCKYYYFSSYFFGGVAPLLDGGVDPGHSDGMVRSYKRREVPGSGTHMAVPTGGSGCSEKHCADGSKQQRHGNVV